MDSADDPPSDPASRTTHPRAHLLSERNAEHYRRCVTEGADRVASALGQCARPASGIAPGQLESAVSAVDLDRPLHEPSAALDELEHLYTRVAVYFHHPRYLAHLNCPVVIPALLGETVLSSLNSSLDTWDQSAGATLIERRLIDWTARRLGLGDAADGVFTSGGTQSNLQGLLMARDEACQRAQLGSQRELGKSEILPWLRVFASECSHFSVAKSASLLGLEQDAVISVPCDADRRMRTAAAAAELDRCRREGLVPMAVVATAGTTDFGSIDPLPEIAELCAERGVWMHVDAAYGCGLMVSRRRRHLLRGIERADSVTVDYHKSLFQPVSSSAVLVRNRESLCHVTYHAEYLNPARDGARVPNQVDKSLQTTRRFDALKLWLTLRIMGADAVGELFDEVVDRAGQGWELIRADPRFEVVTEPQLSTLVFRHVSPGADEELCDGANLHAREALFASGEAVVASTVVDGCHYLKFTLLNPRTTLRDMGAVLERIVEYAEQYLARHATAALSDCRAS